MFEPPLALPREFESGRECFELSRLAWERSLFGVFGPTSLCLLMT